jgi:hypothetical protein
MEDTARVARADDLDDVADERERDGVPVGVDGDEVVGGDDAAPGGTRAGSSARDRDGMLPLPGEAVSYAGKLREDCRDLGAAQDDGRRAGRGRRGHRLASHSARRG